MPDPPWSLAGADAASSTSRHRQAALTFKADSPDYEKPGDANKDNVYEVTVVATDSWQHRHEGVKVTVTNVEEDGTVTLSQLQPRVGVAVTASVTDPDGERIRPHLAVVLRGTVGVTMGQLCTDIEKATSATYTPVAD